MIYFIIFLLGASVGSFLNVLIYRLPKREKIVFTRSICPICSHQLSFFDLIPVFSFFLLKGRCRYCRGKISFQYPLVEIITGLLFLFSFIQLSSQFSIFSLKFIILLLRDCFFIAVMIFIFIYDLKYMLIEDIVVIPAIVIIFLLNLLIGRPFSLIIFGGIIGLSFFLIQYFLTNKKGLGEGDLRVGLLIGVMFPFSKILITLFTSYLLGGIISLFLLISGKKKFFSRIPLGPFLALGSLLTLFFGEKIISFFFFQ